MKPLYLEVTGEKALFTDPISPIERRSYTVPTFSALRGLLESIYWHPGVDYIVDKVCVMNKANYIPIKMTRLKDKTSLKKVAKEMKDGTVGSISINPKSGSDLMTLRTDSFLKNVRYLIEFRFDRQYDKNDKMGSYDEFHKKTLKILCDHLRPGKERIYRTPFLGTKSCEAKVKRLTGEEFNALKEESYYKGTEHELRSLFYKFKYNDDNTEIEKSLFIPSIVMKDGVLDYRGYSKNNGRFFVADAPSDYVSKTYEKDGKEFAFGYDLFPDDSEWVISEDNNI